MLFLLLTVGVLTIGRAGFGLQQAFTSRYAHISILIIISCYLSAIEIYNEKLTEKNSKNKNSKKNKSKNGKMFRLFFIIFLILSIIFCAFQYVVTHSEIKKTITGYGIYDLCVLPKNTSIEAYKNSENYKMLHRWNNSSELDERLYQMNLITVKIINQSKTYGIYFAPDEICSKNYEKSTSK